MNASRRIRGSVTSPAKTPRVRVKRALLHSRTKGEGHRTETSAPLVKPLMHHLSLRVDYERNSWAESSEETTGSISSPESEKVAGSYKPLLLYPTIR